MTLQPAAAAPPIRLLLGRQDSPIGTILLLTDEAGRLRGLDFEDHEGRMRDLLRRHYGALAPVAGPAPRQVRDALAAYFDGAVGALGTVSWATAGSAFQRSVWAALTAIPPGGTLSYGGLAARLGKPRAARAVGLANGANPVALVVPCHRVVGADGSLTGYGGGLARKQWLLRHEAEAAGDTL